MAKFVPYDWDKTLSYFQARIIAVFGAKGIGKTFGLRVKAIESALNPKRKKRTRFVEIMRNSTELDVVPDGYFDRIQEKGFFADYMFKTTKKAAFAALVPEGEDEPQWEQIGYFASLSNFQLIKKTTFSNVGYIMMDEAVIDTRDRYHRYLNDEPNIFANAIDSITRETEDNYGKAKAFLLGNACDLACPYIEWLGYDMVPSFGYHWCRGKTALLHYPEPTNARERERVTLSGLMLKGSEEAEMVFQNKFNVKKDLAYLARKTPAARYTSAVVFGARKFGVWTDRNSGLVYINRQVPKGAKSIVYLTDNDAHIDWQAVKRSAPICQFLLSCYYDNLLRYDSLGTKGMFQTILGYLGVQL